VAELAVVAMLVAFFSHSGHEEQTPAEQQIASRRGMIFFVWNGGIARIIAVTVSCRGEFATDYFLASRRSFL